jgi:hypothetical protein
MIACTSYEHIIIRGGMSNNKLDGFIISILLIIDFSTIGSVPAEIVNILIDSELNDDTYNISIRIIRQKSLPDH